MLLFVMVCNSNEHFLQILSIYFVTATRYYNPTSQPIDKCNFPPHCFFPWSALQTGLSVEISLLAGGNLRWVKDDYRF